MSADVSARSIRQADGLDPVRALQRVLYRSAKQDGTRRFHALVDKVARSDVMWRAWVDVATNQGAPGVDGVTIADITAGGVESVRAFLDDLAGQLRAGAYRPQPLRRVHIPQPGKTGETRPLGIPTVGDRVVMTAAKIVLEPIFEADFSPVSFGFRPKRSAPQALEAIRVGGNRGRVWGTSRRAWMHRHTAPLADCRDQNRLSCGVGGGIRRPFRRPVRTWTAWSSPRLTRCIRVCRETP